MNLSIITTSWHVNVTSETIRAPPPPTTTSIPCTFEKLATPLTIWKIRATVCPFHRQSQSYVLLEALAFGSAKGATRGFFIAKGRSVSSDWSQTAPCYNMLLMQNNSMQLAAFTACRRRIFPSENTHFALFRNVHVDHAAKAGRCNCL